MPSLSAPSISSCRFSRIGVSSRCSSSFCSRSIAVGAQIRVFEESNPVKSATFAVTAVSDAGSYRDYTVIPFSGGLLTNGAKIKLGIVPQGNVPITVSP